MGILHRLLDQVVDRLCEELATDGEKILEPIELPKGAVHRHTLGLEALWMLVGDLGGVLVGGQVRDLAVRPCAEESEVRDLIAVLA